MPPEEKSDPSLLDGDAQGDMTDDEILEWTKSGSIVKGKDADSSPGLQSSQVSAEPDKKAPLKQTVEPRSDERDQEPEQGVQGEEGQEGLADEEIEGLAPDLENELTDEDLKELPERIKLHIQRQREELRLAREAMDGLQNRAKNLETVLGRQGRELGETREYIRQRDQDYQMRVSALDESFRRQYAQWVAAANQLDMEARELISSGEMEEAQIKISQAADLRLRATQEQIRYENKRMMEDNSQARSNEEALLQARPEFKSVQGTFANFCRELGLTDEQILAVKMNFDSMLNLYNIHLDRERGKVDNFKRIIGKMKKSKIEQAARIKNQMVPRSGVLDRQTQKADEKSEEEEFPDLDLMIPESHGGAL